MRKNKCRKTVNVHLLSYYKTKPVIKLPAGGAPPRSRRGQGDGVSPLGSFLLLSEISKISKSLYILNLLSDFFNLALDVNHYTGNTNVLSLGAYGVGFSVKLLNKEVKLPAHRLGRV